MVFQVYIKLNDYSQKPTMEYVFNPQWRLINIQIQIVFKIHSLNVLKHFFFWKSVVPYWMPMAFLKV
jgi:hypothetical protein